MKTIFAEPPREPKRRPTFTEIISVIEAQLALPNNRITKAFEKSYGLVRSSEQLSRVAPSAPALTKHVRRKRVPYIITPEMDRAARKAIAGTKLFARKMLARTARLTRVDIYMMMLSIEETRARLILALRAAKPQRSLSAECALPPSTKVGAVQMAALREIEETNASRSECRSVSASRHDTRNNGGEDRDQSTSTAQAAGSRSNRNQKIRRSSKSKLNRVAHSRKGCRP